MQHGTARAWSMISLAADERQYAGNVGYNDDLRRVYRFDSHVANCKNVKKGDLALIRNSDSLLGVARIDRVTEQLGRKLMRRCPECKWAGLKERQKKRPTFRCDRGHEFERPLESEEEVVFYEAHYEGSYLDAPDAIPVATLKAAAPRPSDQLSIEELDVGRLSRELLKIGPAAGALLAAFLIGDSLGPADADESLGSQYDHESNASDSYVASPLDTRSAILRSIRQRRGQRKFRDALLKRFSGRCVITGCCLEDLLEAAHISPFRGDNDHHVENGLLLRADIHTLFDLHLLAIDPDGFRVRVAPPLASVAPYSDLDGRRLEFSRRTRPAIEPLRHRLTTFTERWNRD